MRQGNGDAAIRSAAPRFQRRAVGIQGYFVATVIVITKRTRRDRSFANASSEPAEDETRVAFPFGGRRSAEEPAIRSKNTDGEDNILHES